MTNIKEPTHSKEDASSHACGMGDFVLQLFVDHGLVEEKDLFLPTDANGDYIFGELDENGVKVEEDVSGFTAAGRSIFEEVYDATMGCFD